MTSNDLPTETYVWKWPTTDVASFDHLASMNCGFRRKPAGDSDLMSATVPI